MAFTKLSISGMCRASSLPYFSLAVPYLTKRLYGTFQETCPQLPDSTERREPATGEATSLVLTMEEQSEERNVGVIIVSQPSPPS